MKRKFIVLLMMLLFNKLEAQSQIENADSLFAAARQKAAEQNYQEALGQINLLRTMYPQNADYTLYAARLYYWSGYYNEAYELADGILENAENNNEEAFKLRASVALAAKKYEELIAQADKGTVWYATDSLFYRLMKAQALEKLGKDEAAIAVLDSVDLESEKFQDAQYLKTGILQKKIHTVSLGYLFIGFSHPRFDPWHFAHFQYMAKTKKCAYTGRLNFGTLFGQTGFQAEFEAYPKISPKSYMYLNTGFSDGKVFPRFRLGAEYYTDFKAINTSLGFRYLRFKTEDVLLLTGHVAANFEAFKVSYRPYLVPQNNQWYPSHVFNFRRSFENKEAYVQIDLQYGSVPYYFFANNEFTRTSAYRAGVDFKVRLGNHVFLQSLLMFEFEEYLPAQTRNRYNLQAILSKRF